MGSFIMTASLFSSPLLGIIIGLVVAIILKKKMKEMNFSEIYEWFKENIKKSKQIISGMVVKSINDIEPIDAVQNEIVSVEKEVIIEPKPKVKKIITGLNATFVDVGYERDGFLHYLDLGVKFKTFQKFTQKNLAGKLNTASIKNFKIEDEIDKTGSITDVLQSGNQILVQVAKEPISTKGPRLTTEITIAGRYMVLVPFSILFHYWY